MTSIAGARPEAASQPDTSPGDEHAFKVTVSLREGFAQVVDFGLDDVPPLTTDEPSPLGADAGPNPARLLASAIGSCLGASLLFCLRKSRVEVGSLLTTVEGTMVRNERGRLRIGSVRVTVAPTVGEADRARVDRCAALFEDFCVVTESVRHGIDVAVDVKPATVASA